MKINHNISAMVANSQLLRTENSLETSIERLSSGLKINHAADDAAGMAISIKMQAQIEGLEQASRNASDGISVLETADGALQEVTDMIQRMRELSVQAASDTNTKEDKDAIQLEISSLTEEINRVAESTEFNTKKLLDGSLDKRVYANSRSIGNIEISDAVTSDKYQVTVEQDARQAVLVGSTVQSGDIPAGTISINGVAVKIEAGQNIEEVFQNIREAAEEGEVNVFAVDTIDNQNGEAVNAGYEPVDFAQGKRMVFVSDAYGSGTEMKISCDNPLLANYLGIATDAVVKGVDAKVTLGDGFSTQASCVCDGNKIEITDRNGFKISFVETPGTAGTSFRDASANNVGTDILGPTVLDNDAADIQFDVTDIGTMTLQIGANANQTMEVRIPSMSAETLGIDGVNVCTVTGAQRAIAIYDEALSKVTEGRSRIGAYQNRLEHAVTSLDSTEVNVTAALSRIQDVDMAEEMSEYTKYNVLSQAATAVLAQANDIPQQTLQLLQ